MQIFTIPNKFLGVYLDSYLNQWVGFIIGKYEKVAMEMIIAEQSGLSLKVN